MASTAHPLPVASTARQHINHEDGASYARRKDVDLGNTHHTNRGTPKPGSRTNTLADSTQTAVTSTGVLMTTLHNILPTTKEKIIRRT
jgi:hypothetical protein